MTEQEAMERLKKPCLCDYDLSNTVLDCDIKQCDKRDAVLQAIKALEENQQYRAIGTPEECQEAVEKQKAKKANKQGIVDSNGKFHTWNGINGKPYLLCPNCGTNLCCEMPYDKKPKYCDDCGQKLDWSDEE